MEYRLEIERLTKNLRKICRRRVNQGAQLGRRKTHLSRADMGAAKSFATCSSAFSISL